MKVRCGGWVDTAVKSLGLSLHSEALLSFLSEAELKAGERKTGWGWRLLSPKSS